MSEGQAERVIIPYITIDRITDVLGVVYKRGTREISIEELSLLLNSGESSINNVTPALRILGLVDVQNKVISLTDEGLAFISSYKSGKLDVSKKIIAKGIEKSQALKFVKALLDTRNQLSGEEIGQALSSRFNKKWKSLVSIRTFGNSCASFVAFAGYGYYCDGLLSKQSSKIETTDNLYPPSVGYEPMRTVLRALYPLGYAKASEIAQRTKSKESRLSNELSVCLMLKLAEKDVYGRYCISELGKKLIDPTASQEERTKLFRDRLIDSPYAEIMSKLGQTKDTLTYESIGGIVAHFLRRDWASFSNQIYGKKLVTWLKAADLLEKAAPNQFKVKEIGTKTINPLPESKPEPHTTMKQAKDLFEIGSLLGKLEMIQPSIENQKTFDESIQSIEALLSEHAELTLLFEMLAKNYQLSVSSKNDEVYITNFRFTKEKVKEKLGI